MKTYLKLLLLSLASSVLVACSNNNTEQTSSASLAATTSPELTANIQAVDAYRPVTSSTVTESPLKPRDLNLAPPPTNIVLGAPQSSLTEATRKSNEVTATDQLGKPLQIGFGRDVAQTATASATNQALKWQATKSGGQVAAINFNSSGAKGMRIGLLVTQLPETATLRFYAKGATTSFDVKGTAVLDLLSKNLAAGDTSNDARTYWSPVLKANNGTLEIEIPAGVNTSYVQVSIPVISHFFMSMSEALSISAQSTYDGSNPYRTGNSSTQICQVDVTCITPSTPALPAASDAVAWVVYNRNFVTGSAYMCSGTLLNDNLNSATPYLLTANHCISSQTVASTVYTEFKYRSLACNNATSGEYYPTPDTGANLLYTASATDSTLLKLNSSPSTSVLFAGWDATTAPAISTTVHSIHHPQGDQQRLSRGTISSYFARIGTSGMSSSNIGSGTILGVAQTAGNTEPGSSGSGLFKGTDANPIVIGQLFGRLVAQSPAVDPGDVCANSTLERIYGRFDVAFNSGISDFLVQGVKGVSRFFNTQTGAHFYSISATEANSIKTNLPQFNYEGTPFKASTIAGAGLSPVYRFFNTRVGVHFFTNSAVERDNVIANLPVYQYEGIGWYAYANNAAGTVPLYRFFNTSNGVHFYTISAAERDSVIANLKQFKYEGVAYYVLP